MPDYKCTACEYFFDPDYMHDEVTCRECEIKSLRARIAELEAERAELVKDSERLEEIHAFLLGEGPLKGCWFGDKPSQFGGNFWWRAFLRHAIQAIDAAREGE